jgi:predicted DCC family thiol-disulfide oxidoreductase YuxK
MKERWILYFDGACPLCIKSQNSLKKYLPEHIKLTAVDLNSQIAKNKGYDLKQDLRGLLLYFSDRVLLCVIF